MEVRRATLAVFGILLLNSACAKKTTASVFNDTETIASRSCSGQKVNNKFIVQWEDGRFSVESGSNSESFKSDFIEKNLENIRKVEHDRIVQLYNVEDDALVEQQNVTATAPSEPTWGNQMIGADQLWAQGFKGQGVLVGVVDSYVDTTHKQLAGKIDPGKSFVSGSLEGELNKHGTHVSGIIAADHVNGSARGVAPESTVIPAPFIDNEGSGSLGDAILALQYVSARGARVVNASWGGAPCVASLANQLHEMEKQGILVVIAAGNSGRDIDIYPEYPAAYNFANQITVAASTINDFLANWSNSSFNLVHIAAPGSQILSTIPGNEVANFNGTSMAAPFVTGAAALLMGAVPQANYAQVKAAILNSVDKTTYGFKVTTGGRLNVQKALVELQKTVH